MEVNVSLYDKHIEHIVEHNDTSFACDILENYIIKYIEAIPNANAMHKFPILLGKLSAKYCEVSDSKNRIENFVSRIMDKIDNDNFIIKHTRNFIDIVTVNNLEIMPFYLIKLNEVSHMLDEDNISILSSAIIRAAFKLKLDVNSLVSYMDYPWRSCYEISKYYLYMNDKDNSLKFVQKALETCPEKLHLLYQNRIDFLTTC